MGSISPHPLPLPLQVSCLHSPTLCLRALPKNMDTRFRGRCVCALGPVRMGTRQNHVGVTCASRAPLEGFRQTGGGRGKRTWPGHLFSQQRAYDEPLKRQRVIDGLLCACLVGPDELCPQTERRLTGSHAVVFRKRLASPASGEAPPELPAECRAGPASWRTRPAHPSPAHLPLQEARGPL